MVTGRRRRGRDKQGDEVCGRGGVREIGGPFDGSRAGTGVHVLESGSLVCLWSGLAVSA